MIQLPTRQLPLPTDETVIQMKPVKASAVGPTPAPVSRPMTPSQALPQPRAAEETKTVVIAPSAFLQLEKIWQQQQQQHQRWQERPAVSPIAWPLGRLVPDVELAPARPPIAAPVPPRPLSGRPSSPMLQAPARPYSAAAKPAAVPIARPVAPSPAPAFGRPMSGKPAAVVRAGAPSPLLAAPRQPITPRQPVADLYRPLRGASPMPRGFLVRG
jgi:hypothetical protein